MDPVIHDLKVEVNAILSDDDNMTAEINITTNADGVETVVKTSVSGSEDEVNKVVQEVVKEANKM